VFTGGGGGEAKRVVENLMNSVQYTKLVVYIVCVLAKLTLILDSTYRESEGGTRICMTPYDFIFTERLRF